MRASQELPTIFATTVATKVKLLPRQGKSRKKRNGYKKLTQKKELLVYFQQMSVSSSFEDCVSVYIGHKLTKNQIAALKLIYRTTKPWMAGHVVGVCLDRINSARTDNKDFAEAVKVLISQLDAANAVNEELLNLQNKQNQQGQQKRGINVISTQTEIERANQNLQTQETQEAKRDKNEPRLKSVE